MANWIALQVLPVLVIVHASAHKLPRHGGKDEQTLAHATRSSRGTSVDDKKNFIYDGVGGFTSMGGYASISGISKFNGISGVVRIGGYKCIGGGLGGLSGGVKGLGRFRGLGGAGGVGSGSISGGASNGGIGGVVISFGVHPCRNP